MRSKDRVIRHIEAAREGEADDRLPARGSASPTCPKCGGTKFRDLNRSDSYQRYECSSLDCMETFAVPIAGALASLNARKEEEEANGMADLKCEKCDRKFVHPKRLTTHAAKCTGGGAPVQREKRKVKAAVSRDEYREAREAVQGGGEVLISSTGSTMKDRVLNGLHASVAVLERRLRETRLLIKGVAEIEINGKENA